MKNQLNLREKRTVSSMISLVFNFIKEHFVNLIKSLAILVLPWILVSSICIGFFYSKFGNIMGTGSTPDVSQLSSMLVLIPGMIFGFIGLTSFSATITCYMKLTLSYHKSEITITMISALLKKYFLKLFMGTFLFYVVLILLYSALIGVTIVIDSTGLTVLVSIIAYLSLIYIMIAMCLYPFPLIIEEKSKMDSVKRCFNLIRKYWWRTFGLIFLLSIIQSMLSYVIMIPMYVILMMDAFSAGASAIENDPSAIFEMMGFLMPIIMVIYSFFYIISGVGFGVNYFCLVEIKEEVGLKEKIAAMSDEAKTNEA